MSLMPRVLRVTGACLQSSLHGTLTVTWRNPTSAELHWPACVHPAETKVHLRADTSGDKSIPSTLCSLALSLKVLLRRTVHTVSKNLTHVSEWFGQFCQDFCPLYCSVYPTCLNPSLCFLKKRSFQTSMRHAWRPLPSVWQPGTEWNVSRQRMSTHKRQLWFRQTLRVREGNIKAKVKSSLGSSAPRFT